jgi:hypothetical protein
MSSTVKRAFDVSDALASFAQKKLKTLISELSAEGVLTAPEKEKAFKHLDSAKQNIYDTLSRELKKMLPTESKKAPKPAKKQTAKKVSRRKK